MKTELDLDGLVYLTELVEEFEEQASELSVTLDKIRAVRLKLLAEINQSPVGTDGWCKGQEKSPPSGSDAGQGSDPMKTDKRPQLDYTTSSCWLTSAQSTRSDANETDDPQRGCGPTGDVVAHAGS